MDTSGDPSSAVVARALERELGLVREAIGMVASGASPRVVVGGLQFGEALLATARDMADQAGVRLVPVWMPDDAGADIAVERIDRG